ncbi:3-dehydroquinate synthase [bacterium]|nr:3-dehydroquinate synthase [bacterium]
MTEIIDVNIEQAPTKYSIYIDSNPISELHDKIFADNCFSNFLVVISKKVYKIYQKELNINKDNLFILNDGESEKNIENYQKILKRCEEINLDRKSAIIAIGGGVVGDIAGFVAASYMRGIAFIQVPTTLLACVDSSVGGKVAINTKYGKNIVGAFYQPKAVYINLNFLNTLDNRQYKSGIAEIIKYAFIEKSCKAMFDYGLFDFLSVHSSTILDRNLKFLEKIIRICIELKITVIQKDEKESGLRKILNFGHTYGHTLENITKYKKFTHGEAVIFGIFFIINYACKAKIIDANYKELSFELLNKFGFENCKHKFSPQDLLQIMRKDKKSENANIKVIVPTFKGHVKECDLNIQTALPLL